MYSIVAQSHIIDKIYLISWLHKILLLIILLVERATFSESLLLKEPYVS